MDVKMRGAYRRWQLEKSKISGRDRKKHVRHNSYEREALSQRAALRSAEAGQEALRATKTVHQQGTNALTRDTSKPHAGLRSTTKVTVIHHARLPQPASLLSDWPTCQKPKKMAWLPRGTNESVSLPLKAAPGAARQPLSAIALTPTPSLTPATADACLFHGRRFAGRTQCFGNWLRAQACTRRLTRGLRRSFCSCRPEANTPSSPEATHLLEATLATWCFYFGVSPLPAHPWLTDAPEALHRLLGSR